MAPRTAKKPMVLAKGRRMRATRLDNCFRPVWGDGNQAVSDGFTTVAATATTTDTAEINVPNANGRAIIFVPGSSQLSGYQVDLTFAEVDPELFSLITGQRVYFDSDDNPIGFAVNTHVDLNDRGYAIEVWAGALGSDACLDEEAEGSYGYFLWPALRGGVLGDHTIENGGITFTITGATTMDGNNWGVGPYNVMLNAGEDPGDPKVPGPLIEALDVNDHELLIPVQVAPPDVYWGTRPLLNPAWAPLVSVTPVVVEDAMLASFTVLPDPAPGVGVWYDFGDGEWDYVTSAAGDTTHTYDTAGTYTVLASTNGVWVTNTVIVPGV